jgi:hypothetical protein
MFMSINKHHSFKIQSSYATASSTPCFAASCLSSTRQVDLFTLFGESIKENTGFSRLCKLTARNRAHAALSVHAVTLKIHTLRMLVATWATTLDASSGSRLWNAALLVPATRSWTNSVGVSAGSRGAMRFVAVLVMTVPETARKVTVPRICAVDNCKQSSTLKCENRK